jgi:hypothetical protein
MNPQPDNDCGPESKSVPVPQLAADVALLTDAQLIASVEDGSHAASPRW